MLCFYLDRDPDDEVHRKAWNEFFNRFPDLKMQPSVSLSLIHGPQYVAGQIVLFVSDEQFETNVIYVGSMLLIIGFVVILLFTNACRNLNHRLSSYSLGYVQMSFWGLVTVSS